ncbi:MAG: ATP-binding protein [bacterium]|nr:ATP-binding protein [Candidatus Colisoma equi]
MELHDSLSQNLAGVDFQITATKSAIRHDPETALTHLETAERMLLSSRTELKRCLWDLRGNTLEEKDMNAAISRTVQPVLGGAKLVVRFNVPRAHLSDTTAHSILCIIRELASNAVRHGRATCVRIAGECSEGRITFSVRDDGCGFDTEHHPGLEEGHFGLEGIRDRVARLNGTFTIESSSETGTRARISIAT